jgi:hypothetical protein
MGNFGFRTSSSWRFMFVYRVVNNDERNCPYST